MRIAVVVPSFPTYSETFILNHITGLIDQGHDVTIIALRRNKLCQRHQIIDDYQLFDRLVCIKSSPSNKLFRRIYSAGLILVYGLRFPVKMCHALSYLLFKDRTDFYQKLFFLFAVIGQNQDIYHFHFGQLGRLGATIKRMGISMKMITSFHGADVNQIPRRENKNYYSELFEHGDHFVANTEFTKNQAVCLGCDSNKISVIPVSLHIKDFPFKTRILGQNETAQILTVGRLVEKKGYLYSIQAVTKLIKENFKLHYTIAGGGPLRPDLEKLVYDLGVEQYVTFVGEVTQEDAVRLYDRSHLFVLASVTAESGDKEGQALVLQEAQACGIPVISTLHNGIPDGVLDGQSGFLVTEKDVIALSEAIRKLLERPCLWAEMGKKGRQFVESKYENKIITSQLLSLYHSI